MLTYPSDPLPQIVCPMDEDAIPPNRFCSAPPHSEPPPPLPPFSSITPSRANDGLSGHRRSGRIQGIRAPTPEKQSDTGSEAARKPHRQNLSPSKRHRERMVQVSQSKQPRVERPHGDEKQNQAGFDFSFAAECQNEQKDQKSPRTKNDVSAAEDVVEQFADNTTYNLDATKSDMDACGGLSVGHTIEAAAATKGWVIGPLFQSFRSKMASFTEIVMSPVKLFRANSPPPSTEYPDRVDECELEADGTSDGEPSEPSSVFHLEAQSEKGDQDAMANRLKLGEVEGAQTVDIKYSKKLSFDVELSTRSPEQCAITASVPLQHSPLPCVVSEDVSEPVFRSSLLFQPSVNVSASRVSKLNVSGVNEKGKVSARLKPLPRRDAGNRTKVTSKTCELRKEESDPEVIDRQVNSIQSNSSYADRNSSSSVCSAQPHGDNDGKIESCHLIRQSLRNNLKDDANGRTLKPSLDAQQLYTFQANHETHSATGVGRVKRDLKLECRSEDVKRKRITADVCRKGSKKQELLNAASDSGALGGLKPPGRDFLSTDIVANEEETLRPAKTRQAVSLRNKKGKGGQEMLAMINEVVLNTHTESSPDAMVVCSSGHKAKPGGSCKRLKAKKGLGKPHVNIENGMDLETTIAITSMKPVAPEPLSEVLVRPEIKQLQNVSKRRNVSKKPLKRKSPGHGVEPTESDSTLVSTSSALSVEPLEVTPTDLNTSEQIQEEASRRTGLNQSSKRPKKGFRGAAKSCASSGNQETKQSNLHLIAKENQSQEGKGRISVDPVYFEMTPFESNRQPSSSASQPHLDSCVPLANDNKEEEEKRAASVEDEGFPIESGNHSGVSRLRSSARRVNIKPRRADNQRRKCRILHSRTRKGEEMRNSVTMDDADLAAAGTSVSRNGLSRRLLRSYSCPEIPSLHSFDAPWTPLHAPHHSRAHTSHQQQAFHAPLPHHIHRSLRRARRHTVCSVEVEREIAPLCLRKEVYPSRRSLPYDSVSQSLSASVALSPSTYLSALASSFLSSPLAFLSKKMDGRGAAASPSTSSHVSSPTSSSSSVYPLSPTTWHLSGFLQRAESSNASLDPTTSRIPLQCGIERRHQSEEEDDGENTSSSSQEFEDVALREEKALSDSEIKVVQKHEERGKVSSIRIRKTLPKPQNNLTPMGLPKPIRLKKKEFSLEEIYTNKNFSKPPESRLETIFEVPLNRRNGSESWFGQRRLKRFLEFLEVGEARKPKKPLVGAGKGGISSSRTRRGGFPKDEPSLGVQDVDSLLCAKLDQLNLWLMHDQKDS